MKVQLFEVDLYVRIGLLYSLHSGAERATYRSANIAFRQSCIVDNATYTNTGRNTCPPLRETTAAPLNSTAIRGHQSVNGLKP